MSKSFKQFINEMPQLDKALDRSRLDHSLTIRSWEMQHHNSNHLGNNHYHLDTGFDHVFYHTNNKGKIDSYSNILDGVQEMIHRNPNVSKEIVHQNFKHALNFHGKITSDTVHSPGGKHFWKNIHTNFPGNKITVSDNTGHETELSKKDMNKHEHKFWNDHNTRFHIYK